MAGVAPTERFDALVIGGGFFGCSIALHLRRFLNRVAVADEADDIMQRASFHNQARVHQGYHYPRSILTALRSRVNFERFADTYRECIDSSFTSLYAIGRDFSHVTAPQFITFCQRIGAPIDRAPAPLRALFEPRHIEDVFLVREWAFNADLLRQAVRARLHAAGVELCLQARVTRLAPRSDGPVLAMAETSGHPIVMQANTVFNCTYAGINHVLAGSDLPLIPLKHELTEMALVEPPAALRDVAITVMCGPFFSFMPFPARRLHTLSHVRYTPHWSWEESQSPPRRLDARATTQSRHVAMVKDAQRYVPALADCRFRESLWEVKTVLPSSEGSDSRPILFQRNRAIPNLISVMGGKVDNVFDVLVELDAMRQRNELRPCT